MADQNEQNPPPLLLFPAGGELAPDAFRPVPVTASLFPAEEGEADSFLGQTEPADQPPLSQPSTFSFFQQQQQQQQQQGTPSASRSDPFANISQSNSQIAPPPPQPQISMSSPAMSPPRVSSPPSGFAPAPFSSPAQSPMSQGQTYSAQGPPPTGPSQVRSALMGTGPRSLQHRPMAHPMSGPPPLSSPPMMAPPTGPPPPGAFPMQQAQFDPNRPPPTAAEFQEISHQHQDQYGGLDALSAGYSPVQPHWFYCKDQEKQIWHPFSVLDSVRLEEAYNAAQQQPDEHVISTNGGRYDIRLQERMRYSVFWQEKPSQVRRCSWFYKSDEDSNKFIPYEEDMCERLEEEYKSAISNNIWHRRLEFPGGETIVMHNPNVIVHFRPSAKPDEWGTTPDGQMRPRVVKRGVDDELEQGEPNQVDHIVFVIHGIGPVCDMKFRGIVECVDDFRSTSLKLLNSHFKHAQDDGRIGRIEFLPVYWYEALHGDATGVDRYLRRITLGSISRLRRFTNDTLLDILFYSSPCYCQRIVDYVGSETNRLLALFKQRNPSFKGQVSMIGHSLGSLIVFDMLSHQKNEDSTSEVTQSEATLDNTDQADTTVGELEGDVDNSMNEISEAAEDEPELNLEDALAQLNMTEFLPKFQEERIDMESLLMCGESDLKEMGLPLGPRKKLGGFLKENAEKQKRRKEAEERKVKEEAALAAREEQEAKEKEEEEKLKLVVAQASNSSLHVDYLAATQGVGQPTVEYPKFDFKPSCFFAIGSPIGMFVTVRGFGKIGDKYELPTCRGFFNIFHPFDPVAYRIEPLVNASLSEIKPVLMPHHKGRKRFHLELKESLTTLGSDLKRSFMDSMKKTWSTLHQFALAHRSSSTEGVDGASGSEVTEEDMEAVAEKLSKDELERKEREALAANESDASSKLDLEMELQLGQLNGGRRIDYVLQEAPFESFNEYIFALGSHACYWESEDTVLMVLREIYALRGVFPILHGPEKIKSSIPTTPH